jgi:hypothetical protein
MSGLYGPLVVTAGCVANLCFAAMFLARVRSPDRAGPLGFLGTAMAIPLLAAALIAIPAGMQGWEIALPLVFVGFAMVEIAVDVVADFDVRSTGWLWPYLMSFYLAQWAVIGAAFRVSEPGGVAVLVTYFICMAATAYSYRKVGHGTQTRMPDRKRASAV